MKASSKQYAIALNDLVEGKNEKEISIVLKNFSAMLKKNNSTSRLDVILIEFNNIWNKRNGIIEALVISARALDNKTKKSIVDYIKNITKSEEVILKEDVDKKLLGGVILKYEDKIVDSSIRGRVESLKRNLIK